MGNLQHSEKRKESDGERVRRRKEGKKKGTKGGGREEKRKEGKPFTQTSPQIFKI